MNATSSPSAKLGVFLNCSSVCSSSRLGETERMVGEGTQVGFHVSKPCPKWKKRKRTKTRVKIMMPSAVEGITPRVAKYWRHRYSLFSRYDEGIKLDEEGWFSVTPQDIASRHAERTGCGRVVIDCFSGVGGNAIQFARVCYHVVAIDIDPQKVVLASNNAKIYGVEDYIDFIVGDFFQLAPFLKGDVVFLSPPWGGPSYTAIENYTLDLLKPKDGYSLFQVAQGITPNIIMFLPRTVDLSQVEELSWLSSPPLNVEGGLEPVNHTEDGKVIELAHFHSASLYRRELSSRSPCQFHHPNRRKLTWKESYGTSSVRKIEEGTSSYRSL